MRFDRLIWFAIAIAVTPAMARGDLTLGMALEPPALDLTFGPAAESNIVLHLLPRTGVWNAKLRDIRENSPIPANDCHRRELGAVIGRDLHPQSLAARDARPVDRLFA